MIENLLLTLSLFFFSINIYANPSNPLPTKDPDILPTSNMNIPETHQSDLIKREIEQKDNGFIESYNESAKFLLNLKENSSNEIQTKRDNKEIDYNHLKNNLPQLAFTFKTLKAINKDKIIGYAPIGNFVDKGWTGIKIFFSDQDLGNCSYSIFNLKLSHEEAPLNQTNEYLVNNKPSSTMVEGTSHSGFLYSLNWFTTEEIKQLECADMHLDKMKMQKMIILANKIDKD